MLDGSTIVNISDPGCTHVAGTRGALAHEPGKRRANLRVVDLSLRERQPRAGILERRLGRDARLTSAIELALGDGARVSQSLCALLVAARDAGGVLRSRHHRAGRQPLLANGRVVDARKQLALLDDLPVVRERLHHSPAHFGADLGLAHRLERAREQRSHTQHRLLDDGDVLDADLHDRIALLGRTRFIVATTARRDERDDEQEDSVSDGALEDHGAKAPV